MSATYHRRQARGLCGMCGRRPPAPARKCCGPCLDTQQGKPRQAYGPYTATKQRYYATVIRPQQLQAREAPGVNQIGCCGTFKPVPHIPYTLPCCGRYVGLMKSRRKEAPSCG